MPPPHYGRDRWVHLRHDDICNTGLYAVARTSPDTLGDDRDKALTFTGFRYASRSQDPAGLLNGGATPHPRGPYSGVQRPLRTRPTAHRTYAGEA
ncbi:hypothetical protein [Streptomyces jumonjinensis]|uniref:hypothetical protein n=1 Tax=Streptomyces jumonjinensis TaxID=1945 RepID=UPI0037AD2EED